MYEQLSSALTEKVEILTLVQDDETGDLAWAPLGTRWSAVEVDSYRNLFSAVGVGTRGATVTIRPYPKLTLHHALRWRGEFLHLTSILLNREQNQQEIKAAICQNVTLTAKPQARTGRDALNRPTKVEQASFTFPGILAEMYYRNDQDEIFRSTMQRRALVTPKAVVLRAGDLVQLNDGAPYTVRQVLDLEAYKNEYVIERQEDV